MILGLDDVRAQNRILVGGKGASLARCRGLGLPVPEGFCVTTDAFAAVAARVQDGDAEPCGAESLALPSDLEAELIAAYNRLGRPAVAVRSSGVDEDGQSSSLAGQHETLLGVRGEAALLDAVRTCWGSAWSESVIAYRRQRGITGASPVAVVVQRMVTPEVSGVLFTRDPVSGAEGTAVVSASYGLGESVVSGLVVPDVFVMLVNPPRVVSRLQGSKETRVDPGPQGVVTTQVSPAERNRLCISDDHLLRLLDIGVRLEKDCGCAQDIEWALCDGSIVLLQSRPVTARAGNTESVERLVGRRERHSVCTRVENFVRADVAEHLPRPLPLDLTASHRLIEAVGVLFSRAGLRPPKPEELIRGDSDGVIRLHATLPSQPPLALARLLAMAARSTRHDPGRWRQEEAAIRRRADHLARLVDQCGDADSATLLNLLDRVIDAAAHVLYERYRNYLIPLALTRALTMRIAAVASSETDIQEEDLYRGLPHVTAEANAGVSRLTERLRDLGLDRLLRDFGPRRFLEELDSLSGGVAFREELLGFLDEFGGRAGTPYLAFSSRSWRERPEDLLGLISVQLRGSLRSGRADIKAGSGSVVQDTAKRLPVFLRTCWYRAVARQRALHVGREGTLYLIEELYFQARRLMDEISTRLVSRDLLKTGEDILLLYDAEMRRALTCPEGIDLQCLVERRRRVRKHAQEVWRQSCDMVPDMAQAVDPGAEDEVVLRGLPSAAGKARGWVRVVRGSKDFTNLNSGEILVCPFTDPSWTPLFSLASGVVAEAGGPLSHAAIIAREYGIPAVLGVKGATVRIHDGDLIEVDGTAGVVRRMQPAGSELLQA